MAGDDDVKKLKVTEQLNAAIEKQRRLYEATTRELNAQYEIMTKMREAVQAAGDLGDPLKKARESQKAVEDLGKEVEKSGDSGKELTDSLQKGMDKAESSTKNFTEALKKAGKQFPIFKTTALAATSGVIEAFRFATSMTSMLFKGITTLIGGFAKLSISILSFPFKIFDNLVKKAEAGGGGNELAAAYEAVRKQFGDFKQDASHNVLETAHTIDKEFTQTGLNTWRVFGNLAERIQLVNKVATAMGATFDVVGKEMAEHAGHILAYQKGLGVADENMKDFAQAAIAAGKPMQEVMRETASLSLSMQKQFGGSAKLYSRDMSKMINDVKHFGGVSQKVMVETAVYTRKLGVETDKLLASLDKFDTFESAAESAAKLAQTYGVQIDAFKLMSAESPAEQADMIKKAFQQQGIAVDQLDRKNMKYIASLTGWDEATSKALLSNKNLGVSLDKIKDGSALAEKQQLSQADAMKSLAGAIERLTPSGGGGFGGFIKALLKGFNDGVEWSKEFRDIMINIKIDLQKMWHAGFKIGQEFVKAFPGIKEFFGGIAELFNPARFQKLTDGIVSVFKKFFANLADPAKKGIALPALMKELKDTFFNFLNGEKPGGSKLLEGLKKFMGAIQTILAGSIKFIMESLTSGFKAIAGFISGASWAKTKSDASPMIKAVMDFLQPMADAIKAAWPALKDAFVKLLETAWEKLKKSGIFEKVWDFAKKYLLGVGLVALGAGGGGGLFAGAGGMIAKAAGGFMGTLVGRMIDKKAMAAAAAKATGGGAGALTKVAGALGDNPGDTVGKMSQASESLNEASKKSTDWSGVKKFLVGFAGVLAIGFVAFLAATALLDKMNIKEDEMKKSLLLIAGIGVAMIPAAGATLLLSKVKFADPKSMGIGLLAMAGGIVAMLSAGALMYGAFKLFQIDLNKFQEFSKGVLIMSKVFAVMSVVVLAALGIGLVMAASGGSAVAIAATGFAAISAGVAIMSTTAIGIMKSLDEMKFGAELKPKVDMFVSILGVITDFAKVFSEILTNLKPTFSFFTSSKDNVAKDIDAVTRLVTALIGPPGGISDLLKVIVKAVSDFKDGGDKMIDAGKTFAELLGAVAQLATGLNPPKEFFESTKTFFSVSPGVNVALDSLGKYVRDSKDNLIELMKTVNQTIAGFMGMDFDAEKLKKMSAVTDFYKAISSITSTLTPPTDVIAAAKDGDGKSDPAVIRAISSMMTDKADAIKIVMKSMTASIQPLTEAFGKIDAPAIEGMKVFGPILSNVFKMITGITWAFGKIMSADKGAINTDLNGKTGIIKNMVTTVTDIMTGVGTAMPTMISNMKDSLSGVKLTEAEAKDMQSRLQAIKLIMEVSSSFQEMIGKTTAPTGVLNVDGISTTITNIAKLAEKVSMSEVKTSLKVVRDMVGELNKISGELSNDKIMKIDVGGKLTELSKRVGLGGQGTYTITHKPINITVNLSIQLDAKDIEYGIVNRNGPGGKVLVTYDEKARKDNI